MPKMIKPDVEVFMKPPTLASKSFFGDWMSQKIRQPYTKDWIFMVI